MENGKIYFASDFHLGSPNPEASAAREKKIVKWLESIRNDASHIILAGDMFDFWFEYQKVVPKGFVRFLGKIAELADSGIQIHFFGGNHDLWMRGYFSKELGVKVHDRPQTFDFYGKKFHIGHGDGLGPSDKGYKILKASIYENRFLEWLFRHVLHPDWGVTIAQKWSASREGNLKVDKSDFKAPEREWLWKYAQNIQNESHHDYYIFGHRHIPLELEVQPGSLYINLGEWINYCTYAVFDGRRLEMREFVEPPR